MVEAILTAILILVSIAVLIQIGGPTQSTDATGLDTGQVAQDTLQSLSQRPSTADANLTRLDEWIADALHGNGAALEAYLDDVLPTGMHYALRLDNGHDALHLVPEGKADANPRAGRGGLAYVTLDWRTNAEAAAAANVTPTVMLPGDAQDSTAWQCLLDPSGTAAGPGQTWLAHWQAVGSAVPRDVPYGVWAASTNVDCSAPTYFRVALSSGASTDLPPYAVQLVVWQLA